jgi:hypothetical protein
MRNDTNLQNNIDSLGTTVRNNYSNCMSRIDNFDGRISSNTSTIGAVTSSLGRINNLIKAIDGAGAGFHSSIYRGKYLGDTYTDAQKEAIANGSFDDLFVGDYWTINDITWRIADVDYYYNVGDTQFTKHHVIIVPDTTLYDAKMNETDNTTNGYTASNMYTTNLDNARTAFDNAFGASYIPSHRGLYLDHTNYDNPSSYSFRDMRIELMNEQQLYGHGVWSQNVYEVGTQKTQFRLFSLDQTKINIRNAYWLTNIKGYHDFCCIDADGRPNTSGASSSKGVRPFACLVGE